ncbi:MAG: PDZ domain-containing protein [Fimbriimonadaceae bacterium]|nr:MAG: PDZ domain-containing protein [Fimbriimonadaceae bacterium]
MADSKNTAWAFIAPIICVAALAVGFLARNKAEMGSLASNKPVGVGMIGDKSSFGELNESEYFYEVASLLKANYVEPTEIDQKMATGAIRGMVSSLLDPDSIFYDKEQFDSFLATQHGNYSGIGVELEYRYDQTELKKLQGGSSGVDSLLLLPQILVASVLPGSPAEQAGIKAGDEFRQIAGKYIITGQDIKKLRDLQTAVTEKKADASELQKYRDEISEWVKDVMPAGKIRDHLLSGAEGEVAVKIKRNGELLSFDVPRRKVSVKPLIDTPQGIHVRFFEGAVAEFSRTDFKNNKVLDLRNSGSGNFDEMERALGNFLPAGKYGFVINGKAAPKPINVVAGLKTPIYFTLLVDNSTHGAAAVFAHILADSGNATVEGTLPPAPSWIEIQKLSDGTGYTLATGKYQLSDTRTAANEQKEPIR